MIPELEANPMPPRIASLPRDGRGYPVPKFVTWRDGVPLFPVLDRGFFMRAMRQHLCWICGERLGRTFVFVIGPMCCVNRISSEPPSHLDCATWATKVCPFLVRPHMRRLPLKAGMVAAPGIMDEGNPGAVALWTTRNYRPFRPEVGRPGILLNIGTPEQVRWYARGAPASPDIVAEVFDAGVRRLRAITEPEDMADLDARAAAFRRLLPPIMGGSDGDAILRPDLPASHRAVLSEAQRHD